MNIQLPSASWPLLLLFAFVGVSTSAQEKKTSTLEESLQSLSTLIEKKLVSASVPKGQSMNAVQVQMQRQLQTIKLTLAQKNLASLDNSLVLLEGLSPNDPELLALSLKTREQLITRLKENEIRLKNYGKQILAAKTPGELDGIIEWLGNNPQTANPNIYSSRQRSSLQFVTLWQDYLVQKNRSDERSAQNSMKNIASNFPANRFGIPRSAILERAYPPTAQLNLKPLASPGEVMAKINDLDDLADVVSMLRQLKKQGLYNSERDIQSGLENILSDYKQYQAGVSVEVNFRDSYPVSRTYLLPLRLKLARLVLPRTLGLEGKMEPEKNENITEYLGRVIKKAMEKGNAELVRKAYLARSQIRRPHGTVDVKKSPEYLAIMAYQSAENFRATDQYDQAVAAYYKCLSSGSTLVPFQLIKKALQDIRKNHPEHFAAGVTMSLNSNYRNYRSIVLPRRPAPKSVFSEGKPTSTKKSSEVAPNATPEPKKKTTPNTPSKVKQQPEAKPPQPVKLPEKTSGGKN